MLEISDLYVRIAGSSILNGVTLRVDAGEKLGLIGPNGSGKTTLFNCISGFQPATTGLILFKGAEITRAAPYRRAQLGIGRLFQNFGIFREMSVLENVLTAIESREGGALPWSKKASAARHSALEHLRLVGLEEKRNDKASSLSGGQMRLLEITRAIAFGAELLLLDEPTAGVSPKMKGKIESALAQLQTLGKTMIIIEHDISFIQKLCDRIVVLDVGKVVLDDTPDGVRSNPMLQEIYFGGSEA